MCSCATFFKWVARLAFLLLIAIQCYFLAAYPAKYEDSSLWYVLAISFAPAGIMWIVSLLFCNAKLRCLFDVWYFYVICALIPNIFIIFFVVGADKLDSTDKHLGPNTLKMVLCITPLLLLLLLHSADNSDGSYEHNELVTKLSFQMAFDLFDIVEMIDIVLEENEHHFGIPKEYGLGMIILACFSLLVSALQLTENKLSQNEVKPRFRIAVIRNIIQILANSSFLIIRALIFFEYGKDESIFIAKNVIGIIFSFLAICRLCASPRNYSRVSRGYDSD